MQSQQNVITLSSARQRWQQCESSAPVSVDLMSYRCVVIREIAIFCLSTLKGHRLYYKLLWKYMGKSAPVMNGIGFPVCDPVHLLLQTGCREGCCRSEILRREPRRVSRPKQRIIIMTDVQLPVLETQRASQQSGRVSWLLSKTLPSPSQQNTNG